MHDHDRNPVESSLTPRERLLHTAARLFYAEGIRAVGIERLISEAAITRATFYRHHSGKDDLVTAYLEAKDNELRAQYRAAEASLDDPDQLLKAVVVGISATVCGADFRGCPFINAAVEFPDPDSPIHRAVQTHRAWFHGVLLDLFTRAGHPDPAHAARRMVLLRDGAMIGGYLGQSEESLASLRSGLAELRADRAGLG
ncbi:MULTISPECIES: TetR/AcrR family transcriptional regulator [unclassified Streptomyces]|uniref:TetR/AcrR family transcriptional regulator n=1 Tax=unclassified Streptomyces TaxID=2593676 RepID=UPI0037FAB1D2